MKRFSMHTELIFGNDALQVLPELHAEKVLIVTDPYFTKTGLAQNILQKTKATGVIFDEAQPDPSAALAAKGAAVLQKLQPDLVIALGGGSSMDCAKGLLLTVQPRPRFVAIPTTSGTGSEVTSFSILTHNGVKHPIIDPGLRPDYAILDETLLQNLPSSLIADTGMDAVTHCMEAVCSRAHSPVTDALAQSACRTLLQQLPLSFAGHTEVRGKVHLAATMAGLAFDAAGLGLLHAVIHAVGGIFHVPHGRLGGIFLPPVMEYNRSVCLCDYANLAHACGLGAATDLIAFRNLKQALLRLRSQLHLPATLQDAGISPDDLYAQIPSITEAALKDPCLVGNPRPVSAPDVEALLREAAV